MKARRLSIVETLSCSRVVEPSLHGVLPMYQLSIDTKATSPKNQPIFGWFSQAEVLT